MTALPTLNAGTEPTAAQWQTLLPLKAIKNADQTVNNSSTLVNDSALLVPVAANAIYDFKLQITYNSAAAAGFKTKFTFPTGTTIPFLIHCRVSSAYGLFPENETVTLVYDGTASDAGAIYSGQIIVASTAGTVQFQWAQNTANASNTIVRAGSYFLLQQIG